MRQGGICLEQKDIETALWREDHEGKHFMSRVKCAEQLQVSRQISPLNSSKAACGDSYAELCRITK